MINRESWLAMRTRWKMSSRGNGTVWRGTPDGCGVLSVYRDRFGPGWRFCIAIDGEPPIFSPIAYRTRKQAKEAAEAEADKEWEAA
jgi:hypothetical protein